MSGAGKKRPPACCCPQLRLSSWKHQDESTKALKSETINTIVVPTGLLVETSVRCFYTCEQPILAYNIRIRQEKIARTQAFYGISTMPSQNRLFPKPSILINS